MKLKNFIKTKLPVMLLSAMSVVKTSCPVQKSKTENTIVVDENKFEFKQNKIKRFENVAEKFPLNKILEGMRYYPLPEGPNENLNKKGVVNIRNRDKVSLNLVRKMGEYHANNPPEFEPIARPTFDSGDIRFTTYYTPKCEDYLDDWDSEHFLRRWLMEGSAICEDQVYGPILAKHLHSVKEKKMLKEFEKNCEIDDKENDLSKCLNERLKDDENSETIEELCKNYDPEKNDLDEIVNECKYQVPTTLKHLNKAKYETRKFNSEKFPMGVTSTFMPRHAKGVIAVNPIQGSKCHIPYGSYVYIGFDEEVNKKLSGWYLAADTGGNFPGKCAIDIFVGKGKDNYKKYKLNGKKTAKVWVFPLYETNIR